MEEQERDKRANGEDEQYTFEDMYPTDEEASFWEYRDALVIAVDRLETFCSKERRAGTYNTFYEAAVTLLSLGVPHEGAMPPKIISRWREVLTSFEPQLDVQVIAAETYHYDPDPDNDPFDVFKSMAETALLPDCEDWLDCRKRLAGDLEPILKKLRELRDMAIVPPPASSVGDGKESSAMSGEPVSGDYVFRRLGHSWQCTFQGDTFLLKHMDGAAYIALLLQSPNKYISAMELYRVVKAPNQVPMTAITHEEAKQKKLSTIASVDPVMDECYKDEVRQKLQDIREGIEEAKRLNKDDEIMRLELERDNLSRTVKAALGLAGSPRQHSRVRDRIRITVTNGIKRVFDQLKNAENKELRHHLVDSISTGHYPIYGPRLEIDWVL